jgi:penicillin-binding protein 2
MKHLGDIAPDVSWDEVEAEMKRLMEEYPSTYSSRDTAVRRAVINLSGVSEAVIDQYKSDYENFAWVVALAPADDPQIAVVAMVPQGATAANAAPIVKEVIGTYLKQSNDYQDLTIQNVVE